MKWNFCLAITALWLGVSGCVSAPESTAPQRVRVMTYNIHHGEGSDGKVDLTRIAALIKNTQADIVALQEVDKGTERTGRRDFPEELALLTGMTCVFSNNYHYQGGEYGNAVLTRFPVLRSTNSHFTMLHAPEPRGVLQLLLNIHGRHIAFCNTHLDAGHDDAERWREVTEIRALTAACGRLPLLLCGDFNAAPDTRVARQLNAWFDDTWLLVGRGEGFTVPAEKPRRRIDYLWISKDSALVPQKAWVPISNASDHLPVVAEFQIK
jgi:endonuclease/exonuclease/phosphatase family metal-dependent hydrolase